MILSKVVARFKDGSLMKGTTGNFSSKKKWFHFRLINREIKTVEVEKLKALLYVKDFAGNKTRSEIYVDDIPKEGRKIIVEFNDGEIVIAYSQVSLRTLKVSL